MRIRKYRNNQIICKASNAMMMLFKSVFDEYAMKKQCMGQNEYHITFNCLFTTIKVIFKASKSKQNDEFFREEGILTQIMNLIELYCKSKNSLIEMSEKILIVSSKEVKVNNQNNVYDLLLYLLGTIKNVSQDKQTLEELISLNVLEPVILLINDFTTHAIDIQDKNSQLLVQLTGIVRAISNTNADMSEAIPLIVKVLISYTGQKELVLNCTRILSKLSMSVHYCKKLLYSDAENALIVIIHQHYKNPAIYSRVCFVLSNIIAYFQSECATLYKSPTLKDIALVSACYYISAKSVEESKTEYEKLNKEIVDSDIAKSLKLFANLWTDEDIAKSYLVSDKLGKLIEDMTRILTKSSCDELVYHGLSLMANISYYDSKSASIWKIAELLNFLKMKLNCANIDVKIECLRIISNFTREQEQIKLVMSDNSFIESVLKSVSIANKDLQYYAVGCLINMSAADGPK